MNFYNPRIRQRIARQGKKAQRVVVNANTVKRKTLIVHDWNGREIERHVVTSPWNHIDREYGNVFAAVARAFADHGRRVRLFCDRSEGVVVQQ